MVNLASASRLPRRACEPRRRGFRLDRRGALAFRDLKLPGRFVTSSLGSVIETMRAIGLTPTLPIELFDGLGPYILLRLYIKVRYV